MNSFLKELSLIIPPPAHPIDAVGNWHSVEAELGLSLPSDYKELIELYGSGSFCSYIEISSPFSLSKLYGTSIRDAWIVRAGVYLQHDQFSDATSPYQYFPAVPGLLPCANDASGDIIGWLTNINPLLWHVVYRDRENGYFSLPGIGLVEFLLAVITGRSPLPEEYLSNRFDHDSLLFEPL